ECTCRRGEVVCAQRRCPTVSCPHPALDSWGECCPVCTGACLYEGLNTHMAPSSLRRQTPAPPAPVCCQKRPCPVQCSHPVRSESCCPVCDSCLFEGGVHPHGATFTPSDTCQRCTCIRGSVSCTSLVLPRSLILFSKKNPSFATASASRVPPPCSVRVRAAGVQRWTDVDAQLEAVLELHLHGLNHPMRCVFSLVFSLHMFMPDVCRQVRSTVFLPNVPNSPACTS
uniref:VWFC domain-containing protein n=1 Tax=Neogobius melanostomus TaxID=47308 RepID=A0A8C6SQA3_9GOBI